MYYLLVVVLMLAPLSPVFAGDYVTVTKQADGSYVLGFSARGRVVLGEMERVEGPDSVEKNTENLMRGWDYRVKREAHEAAVEEMKKIRGPMTKEQADRLNKLLEKAR